jgi:acrylyl-CoA reductase (NADPH)
MKYKAYLVEENNGEFAGSVKELDVPDLEEGRLLIKVKYSSLNYKDALAATGAKGVVRSYPFVPGVDVAGEVIKSSSNDFIPGDEVIATGYKIGMAEFGGFGEIVHLPSEWVVKLPENLSLFNAMCHGTAGITAAECVNKIIKGGISNTLPVLVSGATGGVGSIAVSLLSKLGYEVHAITGKPDENEMLTSMGATKIISRSDFMSEPLKPLDKASYSSAVDTVGGEMLAKMISMISNNGVVSCCGNVGGAMFTSSVFPFILRGVQLSGVDSAESPINLKKELWNLLANEWLIDLNNQTKIVNIQEIDNEIKKILDGGQIGRVVIKHGE